MYVDRARVAAPEPPYLAQQLVARDRVAHAAREHLEYRIFRRAEVYYAAAQPDLLLGGVELEVPVLDDLLRVCGPLRAAQKHAHAREQLVEREGLSHIVVRAEVQPLHDVLGGAARRQHQYRDVARLLVGLHAAAYLPAVHERKHEVEYYQIRHLLVDQRERVVAVVCADRLVALLAQSAADELREALFVVDDEYLLCHRATAASCGGSRRPSPDGPCTCRLSSPPRSSRGHPRARGCARRS